MQTTFSTNLRNLRQARKMTQEQVAAQLGVSPQAVSRWETAATCPDVLLLPDIARLYGVPVDDLFRAAPRGYGNEALRLLAIFERSHRHEDFMAAWEAFGKLLPSGVADANDWRSFGVLHEYMTYLCRDQAFSAYSRAMELSRDDDREMYHRTKRQRNLLRSRLGQDEDCIAEQETAVRDHPDDPEEWLGLAVACHLARRYEDALRVSEEALLRFPYEAGLHTAQGDALRSLKRHNEAFAAWQRAYELDSRWQDALFSSAFCHEELHQYEQAARVWEQIVRALLARGLEEEAKRPREMAEKCRMKAAQA